ncbi:MAG: septal ring lytic transglycosylase RlpA family protein, partial [Hyphomicrobiaceae bacterium]|nr:septal ring lytic transglycosylase RlpA family protein [Hyphomicrobiaceae bacterium]
TAAHKTLPLPSYAEVTNLANGRTVLVRINNRGPFVGNRLIDLSRGTARILGFEGKGLSRVRVRYIGRAPLDGDTSRERAYLMAQRWYREMVASGGLRAAPPRRTAAN